MVLIAVARFELISLRPIFISIAVLGAALAAAVDVSTKHAEISAQMMGCRERSKNRPQEQQEQQEQDQNSGFWKKREREGKKKYLEGGPVGPRRPVGAARGWAAPAGRLGHWWPPLAGPRTFRVSPVVEIFNIIFLEFF